MKCWIKSNCQIAQQYPIKGENLNRLVTDKSTPSRCFFIKSIKVTPRQRSWFEHIRKVMQQLAHENIVMIYETFFGENSLHRNKIYFNVVHQYSQQGSLEDIIRDNKLQFINLKLFESMAKSLKYLHVQAQIVHCNIKLSNIILINGKAKFTDLEYSKANAHSVQKSISRRPPNFDNLIYVAPQFNKFGLLDYPIDVWSLGVVFAQLCLFRKLTSKDIKGYNLDQIFGTLNQIQHKDIRMVIQKMLTSDLKKRISSSDVLDQLRKIGEKCNQNVCIVNETSQSSTLEPYQNQLIVHGSLIQGISSQREHQQILNKMPQTVKKRKSFKKDRNIKKDFDDQKNKSEQDELKKLFKIIRQQPNQNTQSNLTLIYSHVIQCIKNGLLLEAKKMLQQYRKIAVELFSGKTSEKIVDSLHNIGVRYKQIGYYSDASELFLEVVEIRKKLNFLNNFSLLGLAYDNLAEIALVEQRLKDAKEFLEIGQAVCEENSEQSSKGYSSLCLSLGNFYSRSDTYTSYEKSVNFFQKALLINQKLYTSESKAVYNVQFLLGRIHCDRQKYQKGFALYQRAINKIHKINPRNWEDSYQIKSIKNMIIKLVSKPGLSHEVIQMIISIINNYFQGMRNLVKMFKLKLNDE